MFNTFKHQAAGRTAKDRQGPPGPPIRGDSDSADHFLSFSAAWCDTQVTGIVDITAVVMASLKKRRPGLKGGGKATAKSTKKGSGSLKKAGGVKAAAGSRSGTG